jgi:hypothetical protein
MNIPFRTDGSFRDDYRFSNCDETVLRFPFPFAEDRYMYAVNLEPHRPEGAGPAFGHAFDIDEHYLVECRERARVLAESPARCQVLPHMMAAEWDMLELGMTSLSADYPDQFALHRDGDHWHWVNRPLGIEDRFVFGRPETLPLPPFEYITRQMQGDFTLQDQRDGNLWLDGGMVTTQADWSLHFDLGMSFKEWHAPVPKAHAMGVFDRALKYLLALQIGSPVRRLNWTITTNPRLDTSPENYPVWGPERATVTAANVAEKLHLRVELQALFRLPRSNAILFSIRCYMLPLTDIGRVAKWRKRLHRVLRDLDPALVEYKSMTRYRDFAVAWLSQFDDGAPIAPGIAPDQDRL